MSASHTPTLDSEKTEVLYGFNKTTEVLLKFLNSSKVSMNICADYTWPSAAMGVEVFRKGLYELKTRSVQSRFITDRKMIKVARNYSYHLKHDMLRFISLSVQLPKSLVADGTSMIPK